MGDKTDLAMRKLIKVCGGYNIVTDIRTLGISDDDVVFLRKACVKEEVDVAIFCVIWFQAMRLAVNKKMVGDIRDIMAQYPSVIYLVRKINKEKVVEFERAGIEGSRLLQSIHASRL